MIATSGPAARPTVPGLRTAGGSGLLPSGAWPRSCRRPRSAARRRPPRVRGSPAAASRRRLRMKRSGWRAMTSGSSTRAAEDGLVHRGHRRVPGGPGLVHPAEELQRVEARRAEHLRAGRSGASTPAIRPWMWNSGMMFRPQSVGRELQRARDVARRRRQVALRQRHDLRPRGGARGVQHHRHVVGLRRAAGRRSGGRCRRRGAARA
jgi:hypothetical protein